MSTVTLPDWVDLLYPPLDYANRARLAEWLANKPK